MLHFQKTFRFLNAALKNQMVPKASITGNPPKEIVTPAVSPAFDLECVCGKINFIGQFMIWYVKQQGIKSHNPILEIQNI